MSTTQTSTSFLGKMRIILTPFDFYASIPKTNGAPAALKALNKCQLFSWINISYSKVGGSSQAGGRRQCRPLEVHVFLIGRTKPKATFQKPTGRSMYSVFVGGTFTCLSFIDFPLVILINMK